MQRRAQLRPTKGGRILKIRLRVTTTDIPVEAGVEITDVMLQPGSIATGWMMHATERPWVAGIVGG